MLHKVVVDGYTLPISDLSSHEVAWELNNVEDFWVIDLNEQGNKFIQWCVQGMFEFWSSENRLVYENISRRKAIEMITLFVQ
tara:strand:- start:147 stop:392 length:246 start_codon:yes stop_codon:yes gene_type:complete